MYGAKLAPLVAAVVLVRLAASQLSAAAGSPPIGLPGYDTKCGNVSMPYPFGFGPRRYYWPGFNLICDKSGHGEPRLLLGGDGTRLRVVDISLNDNWVRVRTGTILDTAGDLSSGEWNVSFGPSFTGYGYQLSSLNELVVSGIVGCCATFCTMLSEGFDVSELKPAHGEEETPSNRGYFCASNSRCCQASLSVGSSPVGVQATWLYSGDLAIDKQKLQPVTVFVVEERRVEETIMHLEEAPLLLDWVVTQGLPPYDTESRGRCPIDVQRKLCRSDHSSCFVAGGPGYACYCQEGYDSNPYLNGAGGCQILMNASFQRKRLCASATVSTRQSRFSDGAQKEHEATTANPVAASSQFQPSQNLPAKGLIIGTAVGSGVGSILLVLVAIFMTKRFRHMKAIKLKQKYFKQNRGQLLQHLVSQKADIAERMIIPVDELEKATNNFDKACELGGGGHGIVYKGILSDQHVIAIKKQKITVKRK
ncbi:hypothetical protein ACP4OV_025625 [Aristida adscensionis]